MNTYTILCNMQVPGGTIWTKNGDAPLYPDEIPATFREMVEVKKGKKDKAETRYILINQLRHHGLDFIQMLHVCGYTETIENDTQKMPSKSYNYLIGDNMCFYKICVKYSKRYNVMVLDLDNLLSVSDPVDVIDTWGNKDDHTITMLGKAYMRAISELFGMTGIERKIPLTIAGIARRVYFRNPQKHYDCLNCTKFFESAEPWFRGAYHGGLNLYADEGYIREHNNVTCYDCNSLYPYVMQQGVYPVGKPWRVKPEEFKDTLARAKDGRNYFFVHVKTAFKLKKDGIPCVCMSKKDSMRWCHDRQWMTDTRYRKPDGDKGDKLQEIDLYLTQTDFFLLLDNYDIQSLKVCECYAFQGKKGLFGEYIDYWYKAKKTLSGSRKRVAKIMLNSLSGSMARRVDYVNGTIYFDERDQAQVEYDRIKQRNPKCYVHIGAAITSYARAKMIKAIKANKEHWLYTDTDSIHLEGDVSPRNIMLSNEIGDFKVEKEMDTVVYYKLKEYVYHDAIGYHMTLAGMEKRDTREIEKYLNKETGTSDLWIRGKYAKEWKQLFSSKQPLMDMYEKQIPCTLKMKQGWFDEEIVPSWHSYFDAGATVERKQPVRIKTIQTSVKQEREKDAKREAWYNEKHKDDKVVSFEEWLIKVHNREKEEKEETEYKRAMERGAFVEAKTATPFDEVNEELGYQAFI